MILLHEDRVIYSLFDLTGNWSKPYEDHGYTVFKFDIKRGIDVRWLEIPKKPVYGILAAPPCTDFSASGAQYWPKKDSDGRTLKSLDLIGATCRLIIALNPHFWCIENPVGRLNRWLGKPKMYFNPCDYGDPYTKKTALWGKFNIPEKKPVEPEFVYTSKNAKRPGRRYSKIHWGSGRRGERGKELRSATPEGFAFAFFKANQ